MAQPVLVEEEETQQQGTLTTSQALPSPLLHHAGRPSLGMDIHAISQFLTQISLEEHCLVRSIVNRYYGR